MIAALDNLFQSDLFVQSSVLLIAILAVVLTYLFGFKSTDQESREDEKPQQQTRQSSSRQSMSKNAKKERKSQDNTTPSTATLTNTNQSNASVTPKQQVKNFSI